LEKAQREGRPPPGASGPPGRTQASDSFDRRVSGDSTRGHPETGLECAQLIIRTVIHYRADPTDRVVDHLHHTTSVGDRRHRDAALTIGRGREVEVGTVDEEDMADEVAEREVTVDEEVMAVEETSVDANAIQATARGVATLGLAIEVVKAVRAGLGAGAEVQEGATAYESSHPLRLDVGRLHPRPVVSDLRHLRATLLHAGDHLPRVDDHPLHADANDLSLRHCDRRILARAL